jgi:UDP-3-O-[3-hydroxymyristoyl] N-acetylglucosamine deacetylase
MAIADFGKQTTLADTVTVSGIGVHGGEPVAMSIGPADEDTGIVFVRTNIPGESDVEIRATWQAVAGTELCTVIGTPGRASVATIEHLLAALFGLGIDNALVEIDGPEVPALDGSSQGFVEAIELVGIRSQSAGRRYLRVTKPIRVDIGDSYGELVPHPVFGLDITIDFPTPVIGRQKFCGDLSPQLFRTELSRARTFGNVEDVEKLWAMGYALGSSLENSIAISADNVVNPEGTRWPDEFVRHKALDAVGDVALAGLPIQGLFRSYKGGHRLNVAVVKALLEDTEAWEMVAESPVRESGHAEVAAGVAVPLYGPDVS